MLEQANGFEFSDFAGETGPQPLIPESLGQLVLPHFADRDNRNTERPSKVAKAQLDAEDARIRAKRVRKIKEDQATTNQETSEE